MSKQVIVSCFTKVYKEFLIPTTCTSVVQGPDIHKYA